jgi:hypothetical protein
VLGRKLPVMLGGLVQTMTLFDEFDRTDNSPAKFRESTYDYLNRADRPEVARIRDVLEDWFHDYPDCRINCRTA